MELVDILKKLISDLEAGKIAVTGIDWRCGTETVSNLADMFTTRRPTGEFILIIKYSEK